MKEYIPYNEGTRQSLTVRIKINSMFYINIKLKIKNHVWIHKNLPSLLNDFYNNVTLQIKITYFVARTKIVTSSAFR